MIVKNNIDMYYFLYFCVRMGDYIMDDINTLMKEWLKRKKKRKILKRYFLFSSFFTLLIMFFNFICLFEGVIITVVTLFSYFSTIVSGLLYENIKQKDILLEKRITEIKNSKLKIENNDLCMDMSDEVENKCSFSYNYYKSCDNKVKIRKRVFPNEKK